MKHIFVWLTNRSIEQSRYPWMDGNLDLGAFQDAARTHWPAHASLCILNLNLCPIRRFARCISVALLASVHENRAAPKTKHMACQTKRVPLKDVACQGRRIRMVNAECQTEPIPTPSSSPPPAPMCTICLTKEADVLCRPCMHIGMCLACATNIEVRSRPVWRAPIKKKESVYIC